jgi:hypothetical protein
MKLIENICTSLLSFFFSLFLSFFSLKKDLKHKFKNSAATWIYFVETQDMEKTQTHNNRLDLSTRKVWDFFDGFLWIWI